MIKNLLTDLQMYSWDIQMCRQPTATPSIMQTKECYGRGGGLEGGSEGCVVEAVVVGRDHAGSQSLLHANVTALWIVKRSARQISSGSVPPGTSAARKRPSIKHGSRKTPR